MNNSKSVSHITPAVGIIVFQKNKVLLVKHGKAAAHKTGVYGLPAGRIEPGETEKETAVRELHEETGLQTAEEYLIDFPRNIYYGAIERKGGELEVISFKVFWCVKSQGKLEHSDETKPEYVAIDSLSKYNLLPNVKKAILACKSFFNQ